MADRVQGRCPVCGKWVALRSTGKLWAHGAGLRDVYRTWCPGELPAETRTVQSRADPTKQFDLEDTGEL